MILSPMGLFATPENMAALEANMEVFPKGQARVAAVTMMGVTWNFCAEATKDLVHPLGAKIALYLTEGLNEQRVHKPAFHQWFGGSDMGTKDRIIGLANKLARVLWGYDDLPQGLVMSDIVNCRLADFIAGNYVESVEPFSDETIVSEFKDLLANLRKSLIEELTD